MDKKKVFLFAGAMIIFIGAFIGLAYAVWTITLKQTDTNVVYSTCLKLNFTGTNAINLQRAAPMSEEELNTFYEEAIPYHFVIENVCDMDTELSINLESVPVGKDRKQLNDKWIKAVLYDGNTSISAETESLNTERELTKNPKNVSKLVKNAIEAYNLYNLTMKANDTKEFNLLLYLNEDTPATEENMEASWIGKITLNTMNKIKDTKGMLRKLNNSIFIDQECIEEGYDEYECSYPELDTDGMWGYREQITQIVFENSLNPKETDLYFDESEDKDHSVMSYLVPTGDTVFDWDEGIEKPTYIAYIQADGNIKGNPDSSYLFTLFMNVKSIDGLDYFDTSQVTDMSYMFSYMNNLTSLNLGEQFNTSQVTNMSYMFSIMASLTNLNLGEHFNTSKVTSMTYMFAAMSSLQELDLSKYNFDTSQVTNMGYMFSAMYSLTSLNLGEHFNTSKVQNMNEMFSYMSSLIHIEYGNLFIHNPEANIWAMFSETPSSVERPPHPSWDSVRDSL